MFLQNINEFGKLLDWQAPAVMLEIARSDRPDVEGLHFPGHYVRLGNVFYGVRPGPTGPVFFHGGDEVSLIAGRHTVTVDRRDDLVVARLFDGAEAVFELTYVPNRVLEFDPYEGRQQGLFDWLAEQLAEPSFFERVAG